MKQSLWKIFRISAIMVLTACGVGLTPVSAARPAAPKNLSANTVTASAVAAPKHLSRMSFAISAPVKEILVKKGDTVEAGQPLMVLSTRDLDFSVQEAEWSVNSAKSQLDRAKDPYKKVNNNGKVVYASGYVEKRNEMEARLQAAQANLDAAKYELAQGTLLAPFSGAVADINIQPGEFAQTGQVVITLADTAHMQIETTDLSERDVPAVQIGQTANVHIKALDVTVTGKVIQISPISETVGGDVVYPVTIELSEQPAGLLWGMSAEVEIQMK
jgi:RND family efflux transporter MFP subunit